MGRIWAQGAIRASLLAWLWGSLAVSGAEAPDPLTQRGETNPPLITIRQFLESGREWHETNVLRLQGVVTASLLDQTYFLQDGDAGVYVFHRPVAALRVGEWVEVTGHPSLGNLKPLLDGRAVRSLGMRALPTPAAVTFAEAMSGLHHMRLIRIQGRLAEERLRGGRNLVLSAGGSTNTFLADLGSLPNPEVVSRIQPGSLLELTGVGHLKTDATGTLPASLTVFARSAADVVVVREPPWWTRERILVATPISLGALGLALLWGWTLRRQVRRQTADLRARLEAQTALEHRYRQLFQANPHPMWVFNPDTLRFLAVNDSALQHYGYSNVEFLGLTVRDIRAPEDGTALKRVVDAATPELKAAGLSRHRKKNGQIIVVQITLHPLNFDGLKAELVLAHDVTEQQRVENALRESEERLALALQGTSDGLWDWNVLTGEHFLSPRWKELLGFQSDKILSCRCEKVRESPVFTGLYCVLGFHTK